MAETAHDFKLVPPPKRTRDIIVAGLTMDSRAVRPGYLFAALPGKTNDGHDYIEQAIENGAVAILALPGTQLPQSAGGIELIEDPNPRRRFARMASKFYGRQPDTVAAVTGTNGKTSVASFTRQLWLHADKQAASMGTLGVDAPQLDWPQSTASDTLTTPDPVTLHSEIADLSAAGVTHLAMEASSHGLDQYRLDGVRVKVAAFTNLSRDHINYHGSMGAYFNAKARLFKEVMAPNGIAVINADSDYAPRLEDICLTYNHRAIMFGRKGRDITLISQQPTVKGQKLKINIFGTEYDVDMPVAGTFQAMNALCALGMVLAVEEDPKQFAKYVEGLNHLTGVRGRIELIETLKNGASIYVDYAHTPDALKTVLEALRPHTKGRLHVVFGAGGDRDKGKRPMMGKIATEFADKVIITDDNPRTESPKRIREEIMVACHNGTEIGDRRKAIEAAIEGLQSGDVLVVAGKGHEQGQIIDKVIHPFDDATEIRKVLKRAKA